MFVLLWVGKFFLLLLKISCMLKVRNKDTKFLSQKLLKKTRGREWCYWTCFTYTSYFCLLSSDTEMINEWSLNEVWSISENSITQCTKTSRKPSSFMVISFHSKLFKIFIHFTCTLNISCYRVHIGGTHGLWTQV